MQQIRHQFACLPVEIAEGSAVRHHPQGLVFVLGDEEFFARGAFGWVGLVGIEPCFLSRSRVHHGYAHAVGKHPYHAVGVGIDVLHLRHWLARALHVDHLGLEGARIVYHQTYVGGYEQLVSGVFQLVDSGNASRHRNHHEMFFLVIHGEFSVWRSQEDVVAHLSDPFEWELGAEVMVIDGGSLVGENPLSAFHVGPDMPYVSASQSVLSHLDDFLLEALVGQHVVSDDIVCALSGNPGVTCFQRIDFVHPQVDAELLVYFLSPVHEFAQVRIIEIEFAICCNAPDIVS